MKNSLQILHEIFYGKKEVPFCYFTGEENLGVQDLWLFSAGLTKSLTKTGIKQGKKS